MLAHFHTQAKLSESEKMVCSVNESCNLVKNQLQNLEKECQRANEENQSIKHDCSRFEDTILSCIARHVVIEVRARPAPQSLSARIVNLNQSQEGTSGLQRSLV
jgi:septal ring factor EnvC (AmiA/AmiB activator)